MNDVLKENAKVIVHIRQQLKSKRVTPIFGAGSSMGLDFPSWSKLIEGIATNEMLDGKELFDKINVSVSNSSITEVLFHHFKTKREKELLEEGEEPYFLQKRLLSDWRTIIHESLYEKALDEREKKIEEHPYLKSFIPILKISEIIVNYNFDDTLEFMLSKNADGDNKPYQVIWDSYSHYTVGKPVIYHPNGYLPGDKNSQQSEELIFSEESFSDQLLDSMTGKSAFLLNQFTKKTCLLIGLSLEDATLKNLLRQSAVVSPGNYHYFIKYENSDKPLTHEEKEAIYNSNFAVYNLITLFFDSPKINSFVDLINMNDNDFSLLAEETGVNIKYIHYFVGSVAVGKSSILSHFGNFKILEEWIDVRNNNLTKPFIQLNKEEVKELDIWVNGQFTKKNNKLHYEKEGIFLVDRTPLDPLSFTENAADASNRANSMLESLSPGESNRKIIPGQIVFLRSDPKEQRGRLLTRRKLSWNEDFLKKMNQQSEDIYETLSPIYLDNSRKTLKMIVQDTAKVIFSNNYEEKDIHSHLLAISKKD